MSEISLTLTNGPIFERWFSLLDHNNIYRARLNFPQLPNPLTMTVYTHCTFFDAQLRLTGFLPGSITNHIVP